LISEFLKQDVCEARNAIYEDNRDGFVEGIFLMSLVTQPRALQSQLLNGQGRGRPCVIRLTDVAEWPNSVPRTEKNQV
jgi:hypothetical protein